MNVCMFDLYALFSHSTIIKLRFKLQRVIFFYSLYSKYCVKIIV